MVICSQEPWDFVLDSQFTCIIGWTYPAIGGPRQASPSPRPIRPLPKAQVEGALQNFRKKGIVGKKNLV